MLNGRRGFVGEVGPTTKGFTGWVWCATTWALLPLLGPTSKGLVGGVCPVNNGLGKGGV